MRALCLGGGAEVWEDVRRLEMLCGPWDGLVIAANDIGSHWPRALHHWVTLHPTKMQPWIDLRREQGFPDGFKTWGGKVRGTINGMEFITPWSTGSSGMLAVQVAALLGCERAVLCGIPMTPTAHFAESQERFGPVWYSALSHWRAWRDMKFRMEGWVRSMSGNTKELLGEPTSDWLLDDIRNLT